jgi:hypothetical protein
MASDRRDTPAAANPTVVRANLVQDNGGQLPSNAEMEKLAQANPVAFFETCLRRYAREVKGYTCIMQTQERLDGKIHPREIIQVRYRDQPHSVFFNWVEGSRLAERALYVEGENDGKMLARPKGVAARLIAGDVVARDADSPDARKSGRYTLKEFGTRKAMERSLLAFKTAQEDGTLQVEYLGIKKVPEAGDRPCFTLRRILKKAEPDGVKEVMLHIDTETWQQVGNVLKDEQGVLVGAYYFRDFKFNPDLRKEDFQRQALTPLLLNSAKPPAAASRSLCLSVA